MIKFNDLFEQYSKIKLEVDEAISSVIRDTAFIGGKYVEKFEENFAQYHESKFCLGVANGTDALEIAIESLNLKKGSEIIVPANSFISSAECVVRLGYKLVFCDVYPSNYTIDLDDLSKKINNNTSAIIAVHLYGHPCEMDVIMKLCKKKDIKIIEDCAQAHGAEYKGKKVGTFGDLGCFSFYPGKNLGAYGDGGAITTNIESLFISCKMIANHGRIEKYNHEFPGRNSRLDGIQAAILDVKLKYLDDWINSRNKVAQHYLDNLVDINEIILPQKSNNVRHSYHLFVIRIAHRDEVQAKLKSFGIETGIHYPIALPKLLAFNKNKQVVTSTIFSNNNDKYLLSLPIGSHLTNSELQKITKKLCEAVTI